MDVSTVHVDSVTRCVAGSLLLDSVKQVAIKSAGKGTESVNRP